MNISDFLLNNYEVIDKIYNVIFYIVLFLMGACIFSFLNVVIYRVPRKISFIRLDDKSFCPKCSHQLTMRDMFPPIISWLLLGGKCRYCGEKVSPRYTVVEAMGGLLALLSLYLKGYSIEAIILFAFYGVLTVVAFVDIDTMEIPNGFVIAALAVGILKVLYSVLTGGEVGILSSIIGMLCVSVPMTIIAMIIPGGFGGGDIKLMFACGLFLGWKMTLVATALGILTGGLYGVFLLARKKIGRKGHFYFGPFLCIGMLIATICGESILSWYLGFYQF
jgi:leader peptidase (prepilin peptidase)/N-methyltransferase